MSDDLESQLEDIKSQIADAQNRIARAEYERETAANAKREALANLKSLGAPSRKKAEEMLIKMRGELAEEVRKVRAELEKAE